MGFFDNLLSLIGEDRDDVETPSTSMRPILPSSEDAETHDLITPEQQVANEVKIGDKDDVKPDITDEEDPKIKDIFYPKTSTPSPGILPKVNVPDAPSVKGVDDSATMIPEMNTPDVSQSEQMSPLSSIFPRNRPQNHNPEKPDTPGFLGSLANLFNANGYTAGKAEMIKNENEQFSQAQMIDPASDVSKFTQAALSKALPNSGIDFSKLSAQQAKDIAPGIVTPLLNMQAKQAQMNWQQGKFNETQGNSLFKTTASSLDPNLHPNSALGQNQTRLNAADRLTKLATDSNGNIQDLTPQQMHELAISTAGLVGGKSGAAEGTINSLVPNSVSKDAAGIEQWLTNEPHGAGQQAFVKQMMGTAVRERGEAMRQMQLAQYQVLSPSWNKLKSYDPQRAQEIAESRGLDPNALDDGSWKQLQSGSPTGHYGKMSGEGQGNTGGNVSIMRGGQTKLVPAGQVQAWLQKYPDAKVIN